MGEKMNHIDLKRNENEYLSYEPLFLLDNYMYVGRNSYLEKDGVDISNFDFLGLNKYNFTDGSMKALTTSGKITEVYFNRCNKYLGYVFAEDKVNNYQAHLYQIDTDSDEEKELFSLEIQKCNGDTPLSSASRFKPLFLNDRYVLYLVDISREPEKGWEPSFSSNKSELYIYDILENRRYEVLDESIYFNGIEKMEITRVDSIDYLVINAAALDDNRYNIVYTKECKAERRGLKEAIYVIPVETLITEVIEGRDKLSYKQIDSIMNEGSIRLYCTDGSKIYYKIFKYYADHSDQEFIEYDIITDEYEKIDYKGLFIHDITSDLIIVSVDENLNTHLQELKGSRKVINTLKNINEFRGFLESRYLVCRQFRILNNKGVFFTIVYDMQTHSILEEIDGDPKVFPERNLIVTYHRWVLS